jgi:uncharacterized membrane-anchored protein YitT (DUF2179 family)
VTPSGWTEPATIKRAHGWLTWFFLANLPPFVAAYLVLDQQTFVKVSLLYLGLISIWACIATHAVGWLAGRVEVRQQEEP